MNTYTVKKAECRKLTKNEKQIYYGKMIPGFGLFFWTFLIAGGMFGILMTTAMMLVCSIATALIAGISTVPEMMASIPWWQILAVGWIGFGGTMGIIMLKAARK